VTLFDAAPAAKAKTRPVPSRAAAPLSANLRSAVART
jgi:hypothetical protein